ncbi:MAG: 4'-phosphopantetheinyl transferase superfamily protein [Bacteroidales bacterium]|nr:4'-phosphopantetheinyl transferase superfamily protein [Bacteroidales bacterium]
MVEVYAIRLIEQDQYLKIREELISRLPDPAKLRVKRFKRAHDEQRSLLGELLVRTVLSRKLSLEPKEINISFSEKGKPYTGYDLRFNLSHSGEWVVAAFGNTTVGIDIEQVKTTDFKVAERFFSKAEVADLNRLTGKAKESYFFDLWTLKESYLKLLGKGLTRALNTFTVKKTDNFINLEDLTGKDEKVFFRQYYPDEHYICSVCSFSDVFDENLKFLEIRNFL